MANSKKTKTPVTVEKTETAVKKIGIFEYTTLAFGRGMNLIKSDSKGLLTDLIKVNLLNGVAGLMLIGILIALWFATLTSLMTNSGKALAYGGQTFMASTLTQNLLGPGSVFLIILSIVLVLIFYLISAAITSVVYNVIDKRANKQETSVISQAKDNFIPVLLYGLANLFIIAVPLILAFIVMIISPPIGLLIGMLFVFGIAVFEFLTQFGKYELLINRRGVVDSFKASIDTVRPKVIETLILNVAVVIVLLMVFLLFQVIAYICENIINVLLGNSMAKVLVPLVLVPLVFVFLFLVVIISPLVTQLIIYPIVYSAWKQLSSEVKNK